MFRIVLALLILAVSATSPPPICGISERITLENTTDTNATYVFTRGTHEGFVVVEPGQTIVVDVIWGEGR